VLLRRNLVARIGGRTTVRADFPTAALTAARTAVVTAVVAGTLAATLAATPAQAQLVPDSATRAALAWRSIGPVNMAGRITSLAVNPARPKEFYVAGATGGVWKTVNAGTTFFPLWDDGPIASLGDIAVAPSNPDIVWLGTGEEDSRNSVAPGYGVYKSTDGGVTWQSMGLEKTQHVGRIVIHPTNPDIVYVAALGAQWGITPERGLYKTTDGGRTWTLSKFISDRAGFVDVAMDPRNPDVLYAASWERLRKPNWFRSGGPGSGLWKTTDAGATWQEVKGNGFPETQKGRITVKLAPSNPDVVYAMVEADSVRGAKPQQLLSGLYRSADAGRSWTWVSTDNRRPFYFSEIAVDPTNENRVYRLTQAFHVSEDGGASWRTGMVGIHEDYHAIWINPADPEHYLVGGDAGLFQTFDRGGTYDALNNMAMGQFYGVSFDYQVPYRVCGGLQDNGSSCGISRRNGGQLQMTDWFALFAADGLQTAQNPFNPDLVYFESQGGNIMRRDLSTGETLRMRPTTVTRTQFGQQIERLRAGEERPSPEQQKRIAEVRATMDRELANPEVATRWNWNTPFILSRHDANVYYTGAEKLFKSVKGGADLFAISGDLSTGDETTLRVTTGYDAQGNVAADATGGITRDATGAEENATIVTIGESPLKPGMLLVGTSDGNVWLTRNDGGAWENLTGRFPGVPKGTYVSRVEASHFDVSTLYVSFDNHRENDFTPYLYTSTDGGRTFRSLAAGIPRDRPNSVYVVREDIVNRDLLYIGTELGVSASLDRGVSWFALDENLPTVPVYDLQVHPRDRELIAGTHGRGVQILDVAPLQQMTAEVVAENVHLFEPAPAFRYAQMPAPSEPRAQRPWKGDGGPNGAVIAYRLAQPVTGAVRVLVMSAAGDTLARLSGGNGAGLHRVEWNLSAGGGGFRGGGRGGAGAPVSVPGFPAGYNPRPAESRAAPDSSQTPAAVAARLASASAPRGGGGGGGFGGFTPPKPLQTGDYRVVLTAGGETRSTVLRVVEVGPLDRAVMVPALR
jgi:photosystem II stability/assembly factor-like uncharacterized protein